MKRSPAIDSCPGSRDNKRDAPLVLCVSLIIVLTALSGCRTSSNSSSGSISGNSGVDELLDDASYATIAPGDFVMGEPYRQGFSVRKTSSRGANGTEDNERPQRCVSINKGFALGKYEVTQGQWQAVMKSNPSSFKGLKLPVTNVSWNDAQDFLARMQNLDPKHRYRLPTEAEWEYACRAGVEGAFSNDARSSKGEEMEMILRTMGWFDSNAFNHPHPVGQLKPNAWGLFDMHGNVREWCQDWYDSNSYKSNPAEDPQGPHTGAMKVNRGGSWQSPAAMCRSVSRAYDLPTERNSFIGFRIVRTKN